MQTQIDTYRSPWRASGDNGAQIYRKALDEYGAQARPYKPTISHLELPFKKYSTVESVLEACEHNSNNAKRALIFAGMSKAITRDSDAMAQIIERYPDAISHADSSILTQEFVGKVLRESPQVYDLLPRSIQREKSTIDSYAIGMQTNGSEQRDLYRISGLGAVGPSAVQTLELDVFKYALSKGCDKAQFYSPENYQRAYESVLTQSPDEQVLSVDKISQQKKQNNHPATAFMYMAQAEASGNPRLQAEYQMAAARAVVNCSDHLVEKIGKSDHLSVYHRDVQVMAWALDTLEKPPAELKMEPQRELADRLMAKVKEAERAFYVDKGDRIREKLDGITVRDAASYLMAPLKELIVDMDRMMEMSETHPEMGVSDEMRREWWQGRGERWARVEDREYKPRDPMDGEIYRLHDLAKRHPEMYDGRQIEAQRIFENREAKIRNERLRMEREAQTIGNR